VAAALTLTAAPGVAAEQSGTSAEGVKLTDEELDQVTAGVAIDLNAVVNIVFVNSVVAIPVNAAAVVQTAVFGPYSAGVVMQSAQASAIQQASQVTTR
jgi:hypothetical protein